MMAVAVSERAEPESRRRFVVADLALAALAQGEYVLEVSVTQGEQKDSATYGFRLVP